MGSLQHANSPILAYGNQDWVLSQPIKSVLTRIKMIGKSEVNTCAGAEDREFRRKSVVIQALDGNEDGENAD